MKIWIIKRKGPNWWGNMLHSTTITLLPKKKEFYAQYCFYKRKDAKAYLNAMRHKEYYEVVGAIIDE
jgi:hypothetical protein